MHYSWQSLFIIHWSPWNCSWCSLWLKWCTLYLTFRSKSSISQIFHKHKHTPDLLKTCNQFIQHFKYWVLQLLISLLIKILLSFILFIQTNNLDSSLKEFLDIPSFYQLALNSATHLKILRLKPTHITQLWEFLRTLWTLLLLKNYKLK